MELSHDGLTALPENSAARKSMLTTLRKAYMVSWLVVFILVVIHVMYLVLPVLFTIFGNDRYLPSMPGDIYGKYFHFYTT